MRNPHRFDFKLFSVNQSRSAMKVCTDSCAFGAIAEINQAKSILDIGTGTGLLSLMLAQKAQHVIRIDAIDIDKETLMDAEENINATPWKDFITIHHHDVLTWKHDAVYDMIICNPPFHVRSTSSKHEKEALAFHADLCLPFDALAQTIAKRSHDETAIWILLPTKEMEQFIIHALSHDLHLHKSINVHDSIKNDPTRKICMFSKQSSDMGVEVSCFAYREYVGGAYTSEFIKALSPFYLFL